MFEEEFTEASFYSLFMLIMCLLQIQQLFIHSHFALLVNILAYWFLVALFILLTFHNNFMTPIYISKYPLFLLQISLLCIDPSCSAPAIPG